MLAAHKVLTVKARSALAGEQPPQHSWIKLRAEEVGTELAALLTSKAQKISISRQAMAVSSTIE